MDHGELANLVAAELGYELVAPTFHAHEIAADPFILGVKRMNENQALDSLTRPTMPKVGAYMVSAPNEIAAFAIEHAGKGVILMGHNTLSIVLALFARMLECRDIFPEVGNASAEQYTRASVPAFVIRHVGGCPRLAPPIGTLTQLPQDPRRAELTWTLFELGVRWVLWHEWAHIRNGHMRLLESRGGLSMIGEAMAISIPGLSVSEAALLRRTLEMDADSVASLRTFQSHVQMPLAGGEQKVEEARVALFAVLCILALMDRAFDGRDHHRGQGHPPTRSRWGDVSMVLLKLARSPPFSAAPWGGDGWPSFAADVGIEAEVAVAAILGMKPDMASILASFRSPEFEADRIEQARMWKEIHPDLSRLSHYPIAPAE